MIRGALRKTAKFVVRKDDFTIAMLSGLSKRFGNARTTDLLTRNPVLKTIVLSRDSSGDYIANPPYHYVAVELEIDRVPTHKHDQYVFKREYLDLCKRHGLCVKTGTGDDLDEANIQLNVLHKKE